MRISEDLQNEQKKKKKLLPLPMRIDRKSRRRRRRSSFLVIRDPYVLFCGKNTKGFANLFVQQGLPPPLPPPPLLLLLNKSNHDFLHEI
jgi:hypothetical protein